jgi:hypothetical protein
MKSFHIRPSKSWPVAISLLFRKSNAHQNYQCKEEKHFNIRRKKQMMYVDKQYVSMARKSELLQHERSLNDLRRQVAQLSRAVAWELEQHHSRLQELQKVEDSCQGNGQSAPARIIQPTLEPVPSSTRKWIKFRKHTHRAHQQPVSELVR